ncbi:tRNA(adenine34) deaminase [Thermodesulfobium acidiphilum]|uniref:tRNA(Adenine34) deaminase n=1 Tax=Thermodesulfobium acidiphilum TaxID=1794699 RepID=A0A2R4VYQ3_THEAF|nr:nucleoside deaminase [Thermodesulfobium acidiphilum]AWB09673.1 tRNA(adenine34) deaminase [Thermodesulfobium acidiphilum]
MTNNIINMLYFLSFLSFNAGELPVGAILYKDGKILSMSQNFCERSKSPIEHAEILAIKNAIQRYNRWYIQGSTIYCSLEPCLMCAGAIIECKIKNVIFCVSSKYSTRYILESNNIFCREMFDERFKNLIDRFFKEIRNKKNLYKRSRQILT